MKVKSKTIAFILDLLGSLAHAASSVIFKYYDPNEK